MKKSLITILTVLTASSVTYGATSHSIGETVVAHPAVIAITSLLNSSNNDSCSAPNPNDVKIFCTGALPTVNQPTIAGNSCGFSLVINCSNGASATITGEDANYEIVDQNYQTSSYTSVGIIIRNVNLTSVGFVSADRSVN